jgi:hypothetical protein
MQTVISAARARPVHARATGSSSDTSSAAMQAPLRRRELLLAGGAVSALLPAAPALALASVGDQAPAFELPSTKGGTVTLSSLTAAKPFTVLYFYNVRGRGTLRPPPRAPLTSPHRCRRPTSHPAARWRRSAFSRRCRRSRRLARRLWASAWTT